MARKRKAPRDAADIPLQRPDEAAQMDATLRRLAGEKSLFEQAAQRQRELDRERGVRSSGGTGAGTASDASDAGTDDTGGTDDTDAGLSPRAERFLDTLLWSVSLTMLHVTLDVLVQNQYGMALEWGAVAAHAATALAVFAFLVYNLHRHPSDPRLVPGLPARVQQPLRQALFFLTGTLAGCYLTHITNNYGYLAVMDQAPPIGCLWVWSIIELELVWGVASLAVTGAFMKLMGYGIL